MEGPTNPPRFPMELMVAIPAAAAGPDRNSVGIDQSGGLAELIPTFTSVSAATSARRPPLDPAMKRPAEAARHAKATCQERSPVRSECRAHKIIASTETVGGTMLRNPTVIELTPSCL